MIDILVVSIINVIVCSLVYIVGRIHGKNNCLKKVQAQAHFKYENLFYSIDEFIEIVEHVCNHPDDARSNVDSMRDKIDEILEELYKFEMWILHEYEMCGKSR